MKSYDGARLYHGRVVGPFGSLFLWRTVGPFLPSVATEAGAKTTVEQEMRTFHALTD